MTRRWNSYAERLRRSLRSVVLRGDGTRRPPLVLVGGMPPLLITALRKITAGFALLKGKNWLE